MGHHVLGMTHLIVYSDVRMRKWNISWLKLVLSRTGHNLCTIIFFPFYQIPSIKGIVRRAYAVNGTRRSRTLESLTIIYCYGFIFYNFMFFINLSINKNNLWNNDSPSYPFSEILKSDVPSLYKVLPFFSQI